MLAVGLSSCVNLGQVHSCASSQPSGAGELLAFSQLCLAGGAVGGSIASLMRRQLEGIHAYTWRHLCLDA